MAQGPYYGGDEAKWEARTTPPDSLLQFSLFLIGDAGEPNFSKPSALKLLEGHLKNADEKSAVIFLGDNVYPAGIPQKDESDRKESETKLNAQLDILKNFPGRIVFVPGNHDWDHWGKEGWQGIRREEVYIENYLGKGNTFLPDNGCPGPVAVELQDNLILLVLDTQWWLHMNDKPGGDGSSCIAKNDESFMGEIERILEKYKGKRIVVAAHHPLVSVGYHGGYFPLKEHLFPMTAKYKWCYIPLPILGSLYVFSRKWKGHIQDIPNPRYGLLRDRLFDLFSKYEGIVYVAGHDHNLQYHYKDGQHYIVSGSGSKVSPVGKKHGSSFTYKKQGFMKINLYKNGEMWLEAMVVGKKSENSGKLIYRVQLN